MERPTVRTLIGRDLTRCGKSPDSYQGIASAMRLVERYLWPFSVCVRTTLRVRHVNIIGKTPAPKGRNRIAQGVSPG
jgi:hypothetical protein